MNNASSAKCFAMHRNWQISCEFIDIVKLLCPMRLENCSREEAAEATCSPWNLLSSEIDSMREPRAEVQRVRKIFFTTTAYEYFALPLVRRQEISPRSLRARRIAYSSASVAILATYHRRDSQASTRYQDAPHFPRPRINIGASQRSKCKCARSNSDLRYWILFAGCQHTPTHALVRTTSLPSEIFLMEGRNYTH